jgi:hypothetical protein
MCFCSAILFCDELVSYVAHGVESFCDGTVLIFEVTERLNSETETETETMMSVIGPDIMISVHWQARTDTETMTAGFGLKYVIKLRYIMLFNCTTENI